MSCKKLQNATFYGILDTGYVDLSNWISKFESLIAGGSKIIQIRAKTQNKAEREHLLSIVYQKSLEYSEETRPILIINDDLELCLKYPSVGLHIGQGDTPADQARSQLGPNRIIGLSTHSEKQATGAMSLPAGTINYFAVGPIFATQTKPDYQPVGLELANWVASQKPKLPFFCIGGINRNNAHLVTKAGAKRIVTVSDVLCDSDTAKAVKKSISLIQKAP